MFTTLMESRAGRARNTRGAVVSVVLHGTAIAAAVALTMPGRVDARPEPHLKPLVFIAAPIVPRASAPHSPMPMHTSTSPTVPQIALPVIHEPTVAPTVLPQVELRGPELPDLVIIGGPPRGGSVSTGPGGHGELESGGIVSEHMVDQVPRMIGSAAPPRYPVVLRESGVPGRVVVRFVVDTMGRAELGDVVIVEATHALFADAVKNALERYRFTPGAVEGRMVRTMVQLPFTFSLRP